MTWKDHRSAALSMTERKRRNSPTMPVGRWIRPDRRLAIYLRDKFLCLLCERDLAATAAPREMSLDHWRPRARGGTNESTNLFTACHMCNSARRGRALPRGSRPRVALAAAAEVPIAIARELMSTSSHWASAHGKAADIALARRGIILGRMHRDDFSRAIANIAPMHRCAQQEGNCKAADCPQHGFVGT